MNKDPPDDGDRGAELPPRWTFVADPEDGRLLDVDERFAAAHGLDHSAAVGRPLGAFYCGSIPLTGGSDRRPVTATAETSDGAVPVTVDLGHTATGVVGTVEPAATDREAREGAVVDDRIRNLHHAATDILGATDVRSVYERAVETAETVLAFDFCAVFVADDGKLRLAAASDPAFGTHEAKSTDEGVAGLTYRENRPILVGDAATHSVAEPADGDYASAVSVPVGDEAVFQAISTVEGYFDRGDLEVAELLGIHVGEAVDRIRSEDRVRDTKRKIERLHAVATDLESCTSHDELFGAMIDAADGILGFDWSGFVVERDGWFVLAAASEGTPIEEGERIYRVDEGISGEVHRTKESRLVGDVRESEDAKPTDDAIRSGFGVPVGDVGVFQAVSTRTDAFDEGDLELAELLAANVAEAYERIQAREALRERQRELQRLVENLPGMLYRTAGGPGSPIEYLSEGVGNLTGYPLDRFLEDELDYADLVHPEDRDAVTRQKRLAVDAGDPFEVTYRIHTAGDDWRWVQEQGSAVYEDGEVQFVEGFVSDITESKRHEQLRVLNRVLRHNVRNQATVLDGHADLIASAVEDRTVRESTAAVSEAAENIVRISEKARTVQELLDNDPATERVALDPAGVVARAVENARERFPGATVECDLGDVRQVYALDDLETAVEELVENAVRHCDRPEPTVRVSLSSTDGGAEIAVADDGPGIPEDERRAIRSRAESPLEHGSGLGLWIVSWIVEDSRGSVGIDVTDDGSVVTLRLPTEPGTATASAPTAQPEPER